MGRSEEIDGHVTSLFRSVRRRSSQMRRYLFARIALVTACFALPARAPADLTAASSRKTASDFTLNNSKGTSVKLSNYRGRVVLLDFWATWCEGCKVEIPWYMEFQNKYQASGLSVIGVSVDEDGWKSVKPFLEEKKLNYPVVIGNWDLAKLFGVDNGLPVTL
jgi:thiol-disulfide isomerase/thioredoxin